jgi:hypothetical protein
MTQGLSSGRVRKLPAGIMVNEKATAMEELCGCLVPALSRKDGCLSRVAITDGRDRRPRRLSCHTESRE